MRPTHEQCQRNNALLDMISKRFKLKNDAALSRIMRISPPQVSNIRHGVLSIGAQLLLNIHEESIEHDCEITIKQLRVYVPKLRNTLELA